MASSSSTTSTRMASAWRRRLDGRRGLCQSFAFAWPDACRPAPTVGPVNTTTAVRRPPVGGWPVAETPPSKHADRSWDVAVVVVANAVLVVGLWIRHGGMDTLDAPGGVLTAIGQLAGLVGTYAVLVQLLLMSRIAWLERFVGFDRLAVWHRWTGVAGVTLLVGHAVFITLGYAESGGQSIPAQVGDFIQHYPDVLMSIVGLALFLAVAFTS